MVLIPLLTLLALSAAPADKPAEKPVADDATARARTIFERGKQLYDKGRYAEAIASFEEAFAIKPNPVLHFNIGRCHEQLGDVARAMRAYRDYLRLLPDAKDKDSVEDRVANLERKLKERGVQQLMIFAEPATAYIEVDGKLLGNSPVSVELVAGNHRVLVRAEGYETNERTFVMQIARATEMTFNLRAKGDAPLATTTGEPKPTTLTPPGDGSTSAAPLVSTEVARKPRLFTWVAGGVAVAAVGVGVGLGAGAQSKAASVATAPVGTARDTANAAQGLAVGANVAYGTAGAAAIAAVVLFFLEGR